MKERATAESWEIQRFIKGKPLDFQAAYDPEELERLKDGLIPEAMEDKWFVFYESPFLYFHRSWTGDPAYRLKLEETPDGAKVAEALMATPPRLKAAEEEPEDDLVYEAKLLDFLIGNLLLDQDKPFPLPADFEDPEGIFQHVMAGTGYPTEKPE